jgi:hypothetical protein
LHGATKLLYSFASRQHHGISSVSSTFDSSTEAEYTQFETSNILPRASDDANMFQSSRRQFFSLKCTCWLLLLRREPHDPPQALPLSSWRNHVERPTDW